jgi:Arc/MetJ-type ribon-helix-helix transcriptional regulator
VNTFRLPESLKDRLDKAATRWQVSASDIVNASIRKAQRHDVIQSADLHKYDVLSEPRSERMSFRGDADLNADQILTCLIWYLDEQEAKEKPLPSLPNVENEEKKLKGMKKWN